MNFFEDSCQIDDKTLTLQVGKLAKASEVSVLGRIGDTCVLVTVNTAKTSEDLDYLPLHVEYVEKLYAGGKIKGSRWVKREGKPTDEAVLNARLIDRGIRPFFPKNYNKSIQIIITLLSIDGVNSPEILAAVTTSAALHISSIPWNGPLGTIRIGCIKANEDDSFIVNPDVNELAISYLDMIVTSTKEKVVMLEAQAEILSEKTILNGIELAKKENEKIIDFINKFQKKVGLPKEKINEEIYNQKIVSILKKDFSKEIDELIKHKAEKEFDDETVKKTLLEKINEKYKDEFENKEILRAMDYIVSQTVRDKILKTKKRLDNRKEDEIRDLFVELSILQNSRFSNFSKRGHPSVIDCYFRIT